MAMRDGCYVPNINQAQRRVAGRFNPHKTSFFWSYEVRNVELDARGEGHLYTVRCGDLCKVSMGATVNVRHRDDMGSGRQRLEDARSRRRTRRKREGVSGVLQSSNGTFDVISV